MSNDTNASSIITDHPFSKDGERNLCRQCGLAEAAHKHSVEKIIAKLITGTAMGFTGLEIILSLGLNVSFYTRSEGELIHAFITDNAPGSVDVYSGFGFYFWNALHDSLLSYALANGMNITEDSEFMCDSSSELHRARYES